MNKSSLEIEIRYVKSCDHKLKVFFCYQFTMLQIRLPFNND